MSNKYKKERQRVDVCDYYIIQYLLTKHGESKINDIPKNENFSGIGL